MAGESEAVVVGEVGEVVAVDLVGLESVTVDVPSGQVTAKVPRGVLKRPSTVRDKRGCH